MAAVKEFDFGTAIVRIHEGNLSEMQRKEVLKDAVKEFYYAIYKANPNAKIPDAPCQTNNAVYR